MSHIPAAFPERRFKNVHPSYHNFQERRLCGTSTPISRGGPYNPLSDVTLKLHKAHKEIEMLKSLVVKLKAERDVLSDALQRTHPLQQSYSIPPPPMFNKDTPVTAVYDGTALRLRVNNVREAADLIATPE